MVEPFIGHSPYEHIDDVRAFLEEVHAIDVAVYSPEDAGEVQPMVDRYEVNPQTYVYVRDSKTGELAGYMRKLLNSSYKRFASFCHQLADADGTPDPQLEAWLTVLGRQEELKKWRESLD